MTMPGRFAGPDLRRPHVAGDRRAAARGEEHRLHDAVALGLPVVQAHVAGAAVLAGRAQLAEEVALGVGGLRRDRALLVLLAGLAQLQLVLRACCRSSGAPGSWRSSSPRSPGRTRWPRAPPRSERKRGERACHREQVRPRLIVMLPPRSPTRTLRNTRCPMSRIGKPLHGRAAGGSGRGIRRRRRDTLAAGEGGADRRGAAAAGAGRGGGRRRVPVRRAEAAADRRGVGRAARTCPRRRRSRA